MVWEAEETMCAEDAVPPAVDDADAVPPLPPPPPPVLAVGDPANS